jgi:hypothetical protein
MGAEGSGGYGWRWRGKGSGKKVRIKGKWGQVGMVLRQTGKETRGQVLRRDEDREYIVVCLRVIL